jgi:hypothetical protein
MLVANEQVDVFVTLSNPLAFDLELADLSLVYVSLGGWDDAEPADEFLAPRAFRSGPLLCH